jgi:type VII secretion-associated serine protease mycosin
VESLRRHHRAVRACAAGLLSLSIVGIMAGPASADSVRDGQWYFKTLDVDAAQKITRGDGVIVAVLDSGVRADHPDLRGAVLPGFDTAPSFAGDGRTDQDGHGTAMAGLIAGRGHDGSGGVLGIAPGAKILPVKIPLGTLASETETNTAITWASQHGATVMNLSFSAEGSSRLQNAITAAAAADVVLVAGAGNKGQSDGRPYPGAYPQVLTVGSVDRNDTITDFSVTGPQIDLVAPGVNITSPYKNVNGGYFTGYGTSQSTAIVSGAAALVRAKFPNLTAAEVIHRLTATAIDKGPPGRDDQYGYGVLNITGALTADVPPLKPSAGPATGSTTNPTATAATPSPRSALLWVGGGVAILLIIGLVIVVVTRSRRSSGRRS